MIAVFLNKLVKCLPNRKETSDLISLIAKKLKLNGEVEVNVIGEKEIKDLNRRYRGINKVTDVLSFAWQEDKKIKTKNFGQIYICYSKIKKQAKEFKVSPKEEFVRILTHGFLHLLGFDHKTKSEAKRMFGLQEKVVSDYFV